MQLELLSIADMSLYADGVFVYRYIGNSLCVQDSNDTISMYTWKLLSVR